MRPAIRPVPFVGHVLVVPFTETGRRNRSARFIPASDILKLWTDTTTPRTDRPVRFVWLSDRVYPSATPGVPSWRSYPPRVARGYMQSVRPVRFPA